jgi:hypothetical protein
VLRSEQTRRHRVFGFYVKEWAFGRHLSWHEFRESQQVSLRDLADKSIPTGGSRLAQNLGAVLDVVRQHYSSPPIVKDILLYLYDSSVLQEVPREVSDGFVLVPVDYSGATVDGFVTIRV